MQRDTVKISDKRNTLMVAHRGTLVVDQGNTMPSFEFAASRSYWGIECDIHMTADKKIVVNHDHDIGTTCDRSGVIEEMTFDELRKARVNSIYPADTHYEGDEMRIPTMEEYLDACMMGRKYCVIELKGRFSDADIDQVIAEINEKDYMHHVVFISFDMHNCIALREKLPEQPIQFLTGGYSADILAAMDQYHLDLDILHTAVSQQLVKEVHDHGHKINVWTVDGLIHGEYFARIGVDFITSNFLE